MSVAEDARKIIQVRYEAIMKALEINKRLAKIETRQSATA